jgi:hypothetical protein
MAKFVSDFLFGVAAGLGWIVIQALVSLLSGRL